MKYNFPSLSGLHTLTVAKQLQKIKEEVQELENELQRAESFRYIAVEAWDIIHACETLLRMLEDCTDVEAAYWEVVKKNMRRGYYDDSVGKNE